MLFNKMYNGNKYKLIKNKYDKEYILGNLYDKTKN